MRRLLLSCFTLVISFTLLLTPAYSAANPSIEKIVKSGKNLAMYWPDFSDYKSHVQEIYASNNFKPLWFRNGKPTREATDVVKVLSHAGSKGLNAVDYDSELLTKSLKNGVSGNISQGDVALTVGVMRYISDLRIGRVDFKSLSNDFDIPEETCIVLSGRNGAGKTTLFNLISGIYPPTSGAIRFEGADITGLKPHKVVKAGIARTFQNLRLFNKGFSYQIFALFIFTLQYQHTGFTHAPVKKCFTLRRFLQGFHYRGGFIIAAF